MQVYAASYEEHTEDEGTITYSVAKITLDDGSHVVVRGDGAIATYDREGNLTKEVSGLAALPKREALAL
jgi:hypothetical protein